MAEYFKGVKIKAILIGIVACILLVLYSYFVADTIRDENNRRADDEGRWKVHDRDGVPAFCELRCQIPVQVQFRHCPERCHQTQGQDGEDQKIRLENPDISMYENIVKIEERSRKFRGHHTSYFLENDTESY